MQKQETIYFAKSQTYEKRVGVNKSDRRYHMYAIGRTGVGKSTLFLNMMAQDLAYGNNFAIIDPHGDLAENILAHVPRNRINDVVYINPADTEFPIGMNMFGFVNETERHLVAANIISIFRKSWADSWGPRMGYLLHNAVLALLEIPNSTLLSLLQLLTNEKFRNSVVRRVNDPIVRHYWEAQFSQFPERQLGEITSPVLNKIGAYATNIYLRNMFGQVKTTVDFDEIINGKGVLVVNLSKGKIGEDAANLLGSFIVANLQMAAMRRASIPEDERRDFYLYVDEFQNFTTESFANILAEARKYRLNLILAHQYLGQLDTVVRDVVLANVGTTIMFRMGPDDAEIFRKEFSEEWPPSNLVGLNPYEVYYKLMKDGCVEQPRDGITLMPNSIHYENSNIDKIILVSRKKYGWPRNKLQIKI
ncbi:MAG: ATP-binding protein [Calditrichaeota bacterium]|nr:MAG: ATP-binding protein [Calditrichota bacterium]